MKILYYAISDCGKERKENQDRLIVPAEDAISEIHEIEEVPAIFAVFDGMGGEEYGGDAAQIAVDTVKRVTDYNNCDLKRLNHIINNVLCQYMKENNIDRMGTTSAFLKFKEEAAFACNVGDSSTFRFSEGRVYRLTESHSMAVGSKRVLTQHLGIPQEEMILEPYGCRCALKKGDVFLLCTDGLTDMVDEKRIFEIIAKNEFEAIGDKLVNEALANGGKDNVTVILCKID